MAFRVVEVLERSGIYRVDFVDRIKSTRQEVYSALISGLDATQVMDLKLACERALYAGEVYPPQKLPAEAHAVVVGDDQAISRCVPIAASGHFVAKVDRSAEVVEVWCYEDGADEMGEPFLKLPANSVAKGAVVEGKLGFTVEKIS